MSSVDGSVRSELNCQSVSKPKRKIVKKRVKKVKEPITPVIVNEDIAYRCETDFEAINELSAIVRDITKNESKICLTKKEKNCLEEITEITGKMRAPLDDRLLNFYKKDMNKLGPVLALTEEPVNDKELAEATAVTKEPPKEITATALNNLNSYLKNLKAMIAAREMTWAAAQENDYVQRGEIVRLKNQVNHLRVVCTKRQNVIEEKDKLIAERDAQISSHEKFIKELKTEIIYLAKLKTPESKVTNEMLSAPGPQLRRNLGPAGLLANGLTRARNAAI